MAKMRHNYQKIRTDGGYANIWRSAITLSVVEVLLNANFRGITANWYQNGVRIGGEICLTI